MNKNKKLVLFGSIGAVVILVLAGFTSVVGAQTKETSMKGESPLFGIRTRRAISERLQDLTDNIKARFIGERIFFLRFPLLKNHINKETSCLATGNGDPGCEFTLGRACTKLLSCTWDPECTYNPHGKCRIVPTSGNDKSCNTAHIRCE